MIKEPLNKVTLKKQNKLIKNILFQEKASEYVIRSAGILITIFLSFDMPYQYLAEASFFITLSLAQYFIIIRPFLLVCKNAKEKNNKRKQVSSMATQSAT